MSYCTAIQNMQSEKQKALHKTIMTIIMVFPSMMMMNYLAG